MTEEGFFDENSSPRIRDMEGELMTFQDPVRNKKEWEFLQKHYKLVTS